MNILMEDVCFCVNVILKQDKNNIWSKDKVLKLALKDNLMLLIFIEYLDEDAYLSVCRKILSGPP